jgi:hypothetical protein
MVKCKLKSKEKSMSIWDSPEFNGSKKYVNFDVPGDSVSGTVTHLGIQNWSDGTFAPKIELATESGEQIITAGQIRLKIALTEKRPEVGDYLSVTLTQIEDRGNGKSLKHFEVIVKKLNS